MQKVKIVTDSTMDLDQELISKYGIEVVPLTLSIDGKLYTDRVDISPLEFIDKMEQAEELPKSSQPSAGAFVAVYERLVQEGFEVISIHMTGGMSGTVRSAECAAEMTEGDITVIDSQFISKALGFQVTEAARLAMEGASKTEIIERTAAIRNGSRLYVSVDTLDNLVKGGRIGKGKAMIGSLLHIKPIASLEDGVYTPVTKVRSRSQVVKFLARQFAEDIKGKTAKAIGIAHADALELAADLKNAVLQICPGVNVDISYTTPIVSTHTGRGAVGFMFFAE
ncbi:DegV family protein [Metabacillus sp. GX 13764]|uniref:DegV family protein n=1 Tax=Metabacillus kandeliae TaxID=2900151 RepID=UPI001E60F3BF|nr:DegV family protein [Metabacillus kandeliae]MCD7033465.1 DegV family protein [Metabacillus kandeliae]